MKKSFSLLLLSISLFTSCKTDTNQSEHHAVNENTLLDTTGSSTEFLKHLHKKRTLKTYDQSLEEYLSSGPRVPDSIQKIIYLLPIGDVDTTYINFLDKERDYLERFFQLEVKLLPAVTINDLKVNNVKTRLHSASQMYGKGAEEANDEQIEANSLLKNYVIPNKPKDGIVVLGVTDYDIYNPKYNYIFGTSDLHDGTGIISTNRLLGETSIHNVLTKQITNIFSIPNTKDYDCLLNFQDTPIQEEMSVSYLSPLALQKLKIAIGFDYLKRFEELEQYWSTRHHVDNSKYYRDCIAACKKFNSKTGR